MKLTKDDLVYVLFFTVALPTWVIWALVLAWPILVK